MRTGSLRQPRGQVIAPLGIIIGALIIAVLGMFAFEIGRMVIARDQLRAATDAAALAGAATLASSDLVSVSQAHQAAINAAETIFRSNDVFGTTLNTLHTGRGSVPARASKLNYIWRNASGAEVGASDPNGRVLEVQATFGYVPLFAGLFGTDAIVMPLNVTSQGGVPKLDVIVCFDVSGSMDDATKVTLVKRRWDTTNNRVVYDLVNDGVVRDLGNMEACFYPQWLFSDFGDELRNKAGLYLPPGNEPTEAAKPENAGAASQASNSTIYTDCVINLDDNDTFGGFTGSYQGASYSFPNYQVLVEAARGNLDNASRFDSSQADTAAADLAGVAPAAKYQEAYESFALANVQPIADARTACNEFFDVLYKDTQAHFGFVAFSSNIGDSDEYTESRPRITNYVPPDQNMTVKKFRLGVSKTHDNYDKVKEGVDGTRPGGSTYFEPPLKFAIDSLLANGRDEAVKAIVLFTDGENWDKEAAQNEAKRANQHGIPIYTLGLAQLPSMVEGQRATLTDEPGTNGIAALSGNGARFIQVTRRQDLREAFRTIAVYLTTLVK
ncbi:MAG TPA: vWA domain-containing protein [Candidatus Obscuribacterales bacterium]